MFLLTDGTVMMQWNALMAMVQKEVVETYFQTSMEVMYTHGTWSRLHIDSHVGRKYFASAVLADGQVV